MVTPAVRLETVARLRSAFLVSERQCSTLAVDGRLIGPLAQHQARDADVRAACASCNAGGSATGVSTSSCSRKVLLLRRANQAQFNLGRSSWLDERRGLRSAPKWATTLIVGAVRLPVWRACRTQRIAVASPIRNCAAARRAGSPQRLVYRLFNDSG